MKKHEEVAGTIPALTAVWKKPNTVQKLLENNKTFIQYLTHYKQLLAEADAKRQALEEKFSELQAGAKPLPASLPESAPGEIPSLPPLTMPPASKKRQC